MGYCPMAYVATFEKVITLYLCVCDVIDKPHHEEDIFVITRGRGVNNKDILRVQVGLNWLLSQHGFYTTCLQ